jgi:hypothetical protein
MITRLLSFALVLVVGIFGTIALGAWMLVAPAEVSRILRENFGLPIAGGSSKRTLALRLVGLALICVATKFGVDIAGFLLGAP